MVPHQVTAGTANIWYKKWSVAIRCQLLSRCGTAHVPTRNRPKLTVARLCHGTQNCAKYAFVLERIKICENFRDKIFIFLMHIIHFGNWPRSAYLKFNQVKYAIE